MRSSIYIILQMHTRTVPISDKLNMNWTSPKQDSNKDIMFSAGLARNFENLFIILVYNLFITISFDQCTYF